MLGICDVADTAALRRGAEEAMAENGVQGKVLVLGADLGGLVVEDSSPSLRP